MSKFFYKGRIEKMQNYSGKAGFSTNRLVKPGTELEPLELTVKSEDRRAEIETILEAHSLFADIIIDAEADENINELDALINTQKTVTTDKVPGRNDPCSCGSGKKYKKCCG